MNKQLENIWSLSVLFSSVIEDFRNKSEILKTVGEKSEGLPDNGKVNRKHDFQRDQLFHNISILSKV